MRLKVEKPLKDTHRKSSANLDGANFQFFPLSNSICLKKISELKHESTTLKPYTIMHNIYYKYMLINTSDKML